MQSRLCPKPALPPSRGLTDVGVGLAPTLLAVTKQPHLEIFGLVYSLDKYEENAESGRRRG